MTSGIVIREGRNSERASVREVNLLAFGQATEADLVDALRISCNDSLSLVAAEGTAIVGHILFTPVTIDGAKVVGMGLAPMAVLPEKQRKGIGSMLVHEGLRRLTLSGCPFVIVLGHPGYYPRFGFVPASRYGLSCPWPGVPDDAFLVLVLNEQALRDVRGIARYRSEFDVAV